MKPRIIAGIELETAYNPDVLGYIEKNEYHSSYSQEFNPFWISEKDGSLRTEAGFFDTAELISFPFDIAKYKKVIDSFKRETYKRIAKEKQISIKEAKEKYPLNKIYNFNSSCGCHIHFTLLKRGKKVKTVYTASFKEKKEKHRGKVIPFKEFLSLKSLKDFSNGLQKEVKIKLPSVYPKWIKQFYRGYAEELTNLNYPERTQEFNLTINRVGEIEFRSFNLNGIKEWSEFEKIFSILFNVMNKHFSSLFKKNECFEESNAIEFNAEPKNQKFRIKRDIKMEV